MSPAEWRIERVRLAILLVGVLGGVTFLVYMNPPMLDSPLGQALAVAWVLALWMVATAGR